MAFLHIKDEFQIVFCGVSAIGSFPGIARRDRPFIIKLMQRMFLGGAELRVFCVLLVIQPFFKLFLA